MKTATRTMLDELDRAMVELTQWLAEDRELIVANARLIAGLSAAGDAVGRVEARVQVQQGE